jgi:hypothetical protein
LDRLASRRAGVENQLDAETKTKRLARACAIADFVNYNEFIEDPNPSNDEYLEDDTDSEEVIEADPAPGSSVPPAGPPLAGP